ncbi:MAG: MotA/TolQ/ExbB proton channel family protein [Phycisphaeraceae bacterium]|nr:MotA/TolQ/ExbB proton channel family protein [Phycisphaeraceae bacterium]MBX3405228.1 MotA/TolQ/ExbB proton channel family protein [Phycisphaeraceae bacterium]
MERRDRAAKDRRAPAASEAHVDKASVIGSLMGVFCCVLVGYMASHGHWAMFYSEKGMIMVFGGTISVIFMAMPMERIKQVPGYFKRFFFDKGVKPATVITLIGQLAEKARRDGILSLEADIAKIDDAFLSSGLKMAVDGNAPETIESTLRMEVMAMQDRHKAGKKFFDLIKLYAPGYGLVATLIGQVGMFGGLANAEIGHLGHMLAVAVVATMYGTILANAVAGPIGDKLSLRSGEEILGREMMLQGILSIQAGDNPRATTDKMLAFIPQPSRAALKIAA